MVVALNYHHRHSANCEGKPPSGTAVQPPSPSTLPRADGGGIVVPITTATKACLAEHHNAQSAAGTVRRYGYLMARIEQFSANVGLRTIDEWTPALVRQFRDDWNVSRSPRKNKWAT